MNATIPAPDRIIDLAQQAAEPKLIEPGVYLVAGGDGDTKIIDARGYGEHPLHKQASRTVRDVRSFLTYLEKHASEDTELYADVDTSRVVAVIDAHQGNGSPAAEQKHTATLSLVHSPEWNAWLALNEKPLAQIDFANHIEANNKDIENPSPAVFLEIAQHFHATSKIEYKSSSRLSNGETKLVFDEAVAAKAGVNGQLEIPNEFTILVRPYFGGSAFRVKARFRHRVRNNELLLSYHLDRPLEVLESAFKKVVNDLRDGVQQEAVPGSAVVIPAVQGTGDLPVMFGKP